MPPELEALVAVPLTTERDENCAGYHDPTIRLSRHYRRLIKIITVLSLAVDVVLTSTLAPHIDMNSSPPTNNSISPTSVGAHVGGGNASLFRRGRTRMGCGTGSCGLLPEKQRTRHFAV